VVSTERRIHYRLTLVPIESPSQWEASAFSMDVKGPDRELYLSPPSVDVKNVWSCTFVFSTPSKPSRFDAEYRDIVSACTAYCDDKLRQCACDYIFPSEISGSHGGEYEDDSRVGYSAVYTR
jgi:hypothetical protein